jgi:pyruvate formate lyase activating enzyme
VNDDVIDVEHVIMELNDRAGFIEGVTITGGEPLLQEDIHVFLKTIKEMNLKVKIDTNGYLPEKLKELIAKKLVDYIAMDIKTSPDKYQFACGVKVDMKRIRGSVELIKASGIPYEFRTTVVPNLVEHDDITKIGELISGAGQFSIQQFNNSRTYDEIYRKVNPYTEKKLEEFAELMKPYAGRVKVLNTVSLT